MEDFVNSVRRYAGPGLIPDTAGCKPTPVQRLLRRRLSRVKTLIFLMFVHSRFLIVSVARLKSYRLRIRVIDARRIGHLIWQTEQLVELLDANTRAEFYLLIWGPTSNEFTAGRLREYCKARGVIVLESRSRLVAGALGEADHSLCGLPFLKPVPGLAPFVMQHPTVFRLTDEDNRKCERFLSATGFNVDLPFICIHNRTDAYLLEHLNYEDSSRNDYRNFVVEDMYPAIEQFIDAGVGVIRIGRSNDNQLKNCHPQILDLTQYPGYPGAVDHFVGANALFYFGADSGGVEFSAVSSTPQAFINYTSFGILGSLRPQGTLPLLPQMVICKECRGVVPLRNSFAMGLGTINSTSQLASSGVFLRKASAYEIRSLAAECLKIMVGPAFVRTRPHLESDKANADLNKMFKSIIKEESKLAALPNLKVAGGFLARHPYWITGQGDEVCQCSGR